MYKLTAILKTGKPWIFYSPIPDDLPRIAYNIKAVSYEITNRLTGQTVITAPYCEA